MRMQWILFFLWVICVKSLSALPLNLTVNAESAILINAENGAILYEKNAHQRHFPASITKIATAAYALSKRPAHLAAKVVAPHDCVASVSQEAKKKKNYTLPAYWLEPGGTHIGIKKGEELTFKDLLYGMMLASGNDAANVIAHFVSGSVPQFMQDLNLFIKKLGCRNTNFCNPHGLHHPDHQCTAYDMAIITQQALRNPIFREVVSTIKYERPKTDLQEATPLVQSNKLLKKGSFYNPLAIGVKTGYHSNAAHTFVAAAECQGRTLIAVLLKSKEREAVFKDANMLFEAAFTQAKISKTYLPQGPQKYTMKLEGEASKLKTALDQPLCLEFFPAEEPQVKCLLYWEPGLTLPIAKHQRVGEVRLCRIDGEVLKREPLFALEEVKPTFLYRLKQGNFTPSGKTIIALSLTLAVVLYLLLRFK